MEKSERVNTSQVAKAWQSDSALFLTSSAATCALSGLTPLNPLAIGLFLSAGANATAIRASSTLAQKLGINSRLIQVCMLISAIALSTLALPWALSVGSLGTLASLSISTAAKSSLLHLSFKGVKDSFLPIPLKNSKPPPPTPPKTPLKERISKEFPWKLALTSVALGALSVAAYYTLSSRFDSASIALLDKSIPKSATGLIPIGPLLDHTIPRPKIQIIDKFFPNTPQYISFPKVISPLHPLDSIKPYAYSKLPLIWSARALAIGAIFTATYGLARNSRQTTAVPNVSASPPVKPPLLEPKKEKQSSRALISTTHQQPTPLSYTDLVTLLGKASPKVDITVGNITHKFDLSNPNFRPLLPDYLNRFKKELETSSEEFITIDLGEGSRKYKRSEFLRKLDCVMQNKTLGTTKAKAIQSTSSSYVLTKEKFENYCVQHGVVYDKAWEDTKEGIHFIKSIRNNHYVKPTKENLRKICWGVMGHSIAKGEGFGNGAFSVNDPGYRLFKTFTTCSDSYGRASSHFKTRAIPSSEGSWVGYSHFGVDIDYLPPNMRTVLMGMIEMKDNKEATYFKFENWGAKVSLESPERAKHLLFHSLGFLTSQYRRMMGTNQVEGDRKEHMLPEDKRRINTFVEQLGHLIPKEKKPDLGEWGFVEAVPFLVKLLEQLEPEEQKANEIRKYLAELDKRYGKNLYMQKGNEVQLGDSIMGLEIEEKESNPKEVKCVEGFLVLKSAK